MPDSKGHSFGVAEARARRMIARSMELAGRPVQVIDGTRYSPSAPGIIGRQAALRKILRKGTDEQHQ